MKDFKIIVDPDTDTEVLVSRDVDDNGQQVVVIAGYVYDGDETEYRHEVTYIVPSSTAGKCFVSDFSESSATEFINSALGEYGIS